MGKTSPELSSKYIETVCTGGVLEDGSPVRLHPIPFRLIEEEDRFKKYQWIRARIAKNLSDPRPESFRINCDSIELAEKVPPDENEWANRAELIFKNPGWQFESVDTLTQAQSEHKTSLAIITPKEILDVTLHSRPEEENLSFEEKRERLRKKLEKENEEMALFEEWVPAMKRLEFVKNRIQVKWVCGANKPHTMQIMDWEAVELQRKVGD